MSANQQIALPSVNQKFKDRLFRCIFNNPESLLRLYNAINGTNYDNPNDLTINTLEDVIYLSMKNNLCSLEEAVDRAIDESLEVSVLTDYLLAHRQEVKTLILREYDEEKHIKNEKAISWREGLAQGYTKNYLEIICKKLKKGMNLSSIAEFLEEDISVLGPLYAFAESFAPDYDVDTVWEAWLNK